MPTHREQIPDDAVRRREPLHVRGRLERPHLARPLARRLAAELVSDQPSGNTALALQQLSKEPGHGAPIPPRLHQDIEHVAVLVHRAPHILLAAVEHHKQLVEVPRVAPPATPAPERARVARPYRLTYCLTV